MYFDSTTQHQQTKRNGKWVYFGTAWREPTLQSTYVNTIIGDYWGIPNIQHS